MKALRIFLSLSGALFILQSCSTDSDSYSDNEISTSSLNEGSSSYNTSSDEVNSTSVEFDITNRGASSYVFNSDDLSDAENPNITLKRGVTYTFNINAPGHPFYINSVQNTSTANAYNEGVTNNGTQNGTITFKVPEDAPDTLYYICEFHAAMTGVFTIED